MPINFGPDYGFSPRVPSDEEIRDYEKALAEWNDKIERAAAFKKRIDEEAASVGLSIAYDSEYGEDVVPMDEPPSNPFNGDRLPWRSSIGSAMSL